MSGHPEKLMIECENLVKIFKTKDVEAIALQGLDLKVKAGELMAIIGNSGSGKSTLLNLLGGLDKPSAGKLVVGGRDLTRISDKDLIDYKRSTVGFIWQNPARNLVPYLSAVENVEIPLILCGNRSKKRSRELLELVGLGKRMHSRLAELSGGEQQRVAIAIALANNPQLLLADEPTGALDNATTAEIVDALKLLNRELGVTVVIVTHDLSLSKRIDRIVAIRDGKTSSEFIRRSVYTEEMKHLKEHEKDTHIELAVMDQYGRLQIPENYLAEAGLKGAGKVKIEMDKKNRIIILPHNED